MSNFATPFFVIDKLELDKNINELKEALQRNWGNSIIGYSFKTNSLPWLARYLLHQGCYAEVVSSPEYELALHLGYDQTGIIFNGPVKGFAEFQEAILNGSLVNIDSKQEIDWLREMSSTFKERINVGIRVNIELPSQYKDELPFPCDGSRFGFALNNGEFYSAVENLLKIPNVQITGLHLHLTSRSRRVSVYREIAKIACEIRKDTSLSFSYVDIGGGFFGGVPGKPSFDEYIAAIADELREQFDPNKTKLIVEPGSALIGSPITLTSSVIDVKNIEENRVITIDGSRMNVDPLMLKTNHFYRLETDNKQTAKRRQIIVGFTCMEMDRLMVLDNERELEVGDKVVFEKVGAYTMSLNPLFIQYFPDVYVFDGIEYKKIRSAWGLDEYMQLQIIS